MDESCSAWCAARFVHILPCRASPIPSTGHSLWAPASAREERLVGGRAPTLQVQYQPPLAGIVPTGWVNITDKYNLSHTKTTYGTNPAGRGETDQSRADLGLEAVVGLWIPGWRGEGIELSPGDNLAVSPLCLRVQPGLPDFSLYPWPIDIIKLSTRPQNSHGGVYTYLLFFVEVAPLLRKQGCIGRLVGVHFPAWGVLVAVRDGARQQKEDGRGLLSGRYPPRRLQLVGVVFVCAACAWRLPPIFLLQKDKTLPDF